MSDIAIKVENLSKIYKLYDKPIDRMKESLSLTKRKYSREHYALNDISFEIKKGETVGIIGTNGSGKSTLLKIITGVLTQSLGKLEVSGKISALLELGAGFNPEYTGLENIYLNGTMMGYTREQMDKRVNSIIEFADIGEFINQPVKTYSSGMFARLAFAVAINVEPDILIVDEALSVGDIFFQNKCFKKFEELEKKNTTILFVSHDLGSIRQMCSKVLWLNKGQQLMFDDKEIVCTKYINEQFLNMNKNTELEIESIDEIKQINISYIKNEKKNYPKIKETNNNMIKSDKAEIISSFICDKNGNYTSLLEVEKEYEFTIVGKFNENINNIIFGFILENNKGVNLFALNTFISNDKKIINVESGEVIETTFKIKLPKIMKGEYLISPAIARGTQESNQMLTWLHNQLVIKVINEGYNLSLIELDSETIVKKYNDNDIKLF